MPTPYGSRGGLAFGAEELRVLRRALALALHPSPATADDVQDCLRLAASLDEATRESARLRAFLVADLGRYRAALPGTAAGYLALLEEALGAGYRPQPDDLAALRALRGNPTAAHPAAPPPSHPTDAPRHPLTVPAPTATSTTTPYDAITRPLTVTDPLDHTTSYTYDANDNITKITDAAGETVTSV
ncbi:RHS repeat domain-containing protein, partial [Streptomyces griseorubens]|uniref:RHS repeat domain-containing protein n=1 Tax=Streptomyces griseorubens TaxID=66897 RepID=UPI00351135AB